MNLSIKVPDPKRYIALFESAQDEFSDGMLKVCRDAAKVAHQSVVEFTPKKSGATASLWRLVELGRGSHRGRFLGFTVTLDHPFNQRGAKHPVTGQPVNKGKFQLLEALEYGTKPHTITPKNGKVLAFKVGGALQSAWNAKYGGSKTGLVFARSVKHPGTKAYGMMRKAGPIAQRVFENLANELLAKVAAKLNGGP